MEKYSPVLIIVYDRYQHFQKCIESLTLCREAKYTHLYISSDFYRNNNEKDSVLKVRKIIENIKGFKKVTPFCFKRNMGVENAVSYSRKKIFQQYNSLITAEDDNVFSPLFLTYMNRMLNHYKNDKNIFAISGFSPYIFSKKYNLGKDFLFKTNACAVWGFGISKLNFEKFNNYIKSKKLYEDLEMDLNNKSFVKKLNSVSLAYTPHFLNVLYNGSAPAFDFLVAYYCVKNNLFNLHNSNTYVKNNGHDGSGQRNKKNKLITKKISKINYSNTLPDMIKSSMILVRNDFVGHYAKNKLLYYIKILLIKFGIFNEVKKLIYLRIN